MNPVLPPQVSVVVVADGPWEETLRCLLAVARAAGDVRHEVIVVDDGTADETALALPRLHGVRSARSDDPRGFPSAANAGAALARAPLVAFLHADAEPHPGWLAPLVALAEGDAAVAAVASRLVAPSGLVECDGLALLYGAPYPIVPSPVGGGEPAVPSAEVSQVPAVLSAALLVRADRFRGCSGFDEELGPVAADVDLCLRMRQLGGVVLVARESVALHHGRCAGELSNEDAAELSRRWLGRVPLFDASGRAGRPAPAPRSGRPPVSVVLPVRNSLATVASCVEDVLRNLGAADELVAVDAGSGDGTREFLDRLARERPGIRVIGSSASAGAEGALRAGLAAATRPLAVLVSPSAGLPDGFVDELTRLLERPGAPGMVAVPLPPVGQCSAGPTALLREVGLARPGALLGCDAAALDAAVRAQGATVGVVA